MSRHQAHRTVTTEHRATMARELARTLAEYEAAAAARDYRTMRHLEQRATACARAARQAIG